MFYTYMYLRQENSTPYYIGKGVNGRAFSPQHNVPVPKDNCRVLIQYWESEEKALEMEVWYISFFGRKDNGTGILRNLTDGGDRPPSQKGRKASEELRKRLSECRKGEKNPRGMLGKPQTEKFRKAMRQCHIGRVLSQEAKYKIKISNIGQKRSEESKLKMRLAKLGRKVLNYPKSRKALSEESREKLRAAQQSRRKREKNNGNILT